MRRDAKAYARVLWILTVLFFLRVLGQALVAFLHVEFLPPMPSWYSGLLPYRFLLPIQILILAIQITIDVNVWRGVGVFSPPRPRLGRVLQWLSYIYAVSMLIRLVVTRSHPIPIVFHWVLAAYLFTLGHFMLGAPSRPGPPHGKTRVHTVGLLALALGLAGCAVLSNVIANRLDYRPAEFAVEVERQAELVTADGVRLISDIYRPRTSGRTPTILVRIPLDRTVLNSVFASTVGRMWAERGYTVVIQGTRGRYGSSGRHRPFVDERRDGIETLRWIAQQPWYDGHIGMWGGSYFGYTQWVVADQTDPGPSALFIQICSSDVYGMFYSGGAFSLETALYWALRSRGNQDNPPSAEMIDRGVASFPLRDADDRAA